MMADGIRPEGDADSLPVISIVGRPNVGKSTLFNRLAGKRLAIVHDRPGVTRDRRETTIRLSGRDVILVDTAGFEDATDESLEARMRALTEAAIFGSDLLIFAVDGRAGITALDETFAETLRRSGKPVILAVNKSEGRDAELRAQEAYRLGFDRLVPISAEHGLGIGDLDAHVRDLLGDREQTPANATESASLDVPENASASTSRENWYGDDEAAEETEADPDRPLRVAVIGRPNAGKSTLINKLIGVNRLLTGPEAGITRDTIQLDWSWNDKPIRLFDTAGMRRKSRIHDAVEKLSVDETIRAIRFAEVVVLLLETERALDKQDLHLADLVAREGRALVIGINKVDLWTDRAEREKTTREEIARLLPQVRGVPVVFLSAETGKGVDRLMRAVSEIADVWNIRLGTSALNRWLEDTVTIHPPPAHSGRRIRLRYMTQIKARPPTFVAFCSKPEALPESYRRYLINGIRETFGIKGVPVRFHLRKGKNPYESAKR